MDDVITLISETYADDGIMQKIPAETTREVFASVSSVNRAEWRSAGLNGLQPSFVAVMPLINYDGEKLVEWRGVRYTVYRTYFRADSDEIELYLEKRRDRNAAENQR